MDAYVPLWLDHMDLFIQICTSIDWLGRAHGKASNASRHLEPWEALGRPGFSRVFVHQNARHTVIQLARAFARMQQIIDAVIRPISHTNFNIRTSIVQ